MKSVLSLGMANNDNDLVTVTQWQPTTLEEVQANRAASISRYGYAVEPALVRVPAYGERLLGFRDDGQPIVETFAAGWRTVRP